MRKTVPFLIILALTLACRHGRLYQPYLTGHLADCPGIGNSTDPPIVCINPDTLEPSQKTVVLSGGNVPTRNVAHFFITHATSTQVLKIICPPEAPVDVFTIRPDHVIVVARPVTATDHYKYTIDINGRKNDPDMQIDP